MDLIFEYRMLVFEWEKFRLEFLRNCASLSPNNISDNILGLRLIKIWATNGSSIPESDTNPNRVACVVSMEQIKKLDPY